jgi:hypothetical protein
VKTDQYTDDGKFFPFSIRDARHLVPTQIPKDFHVFDYVDIHSKMQGNAQRSQLFHNGIQVEDAPCQHYSLKCYKEKIIQVFQHVLSSNTNAKYFFYMESDNDLCVSLSQIRDLTYRQNRYFLSTGVGFSGWSMRRDFMMDFLEEYQNATAKEGPDPIGSYLLIRKNAWAVTQKYLVSHTIVPPMGQPSLTVSTDEIGNKHLPRCFEPHRAKWKTSRKDPRDKFGWDYFDYNECPTEEVFPCKKGQLERLMAADLQEAQNYNATRKHDRNDTDIDDEVVADSPKSNVDKPARARQFKTLHEQATAHHEARDAKVAKAREAKAREAKVRLAKVQEAKVEEAKVLREAEVRRAHIDEEAPPAAAEAVADSAMSKVDETNARVQLRGGDKAPNAGV